jgi:hypothetical protein
MKPDAAFDAAPQMFAVERTISILLSTSDSPCSRAKLLPRLGARLETIRAV